MIGSILMSAGEVFWLFHEIMMTISLYEIYYNTYRYRAINKLIVFVLIKPVFFIG